MLKLLKSKARSRRKGRARFGQGGQALIEFMMIIPIVMTLVWYLIHVSMAVNKSIVGQKAARSQLFLKLYNHRSGPVKSEMVNSERSHFYIGVSGALVKGGGTKPVAPTEMMGIGATPKLVKDAYDDPGESPPNSLRQRIRVRTIFGICTHRKKNKDGVGLTDFCGTDPSG